MSNTHENHNHKHESNEQLIHDARVAARINLASGFAKTALGFISQSPVLVTDGVHDFGDYDTYKEDARGISEIEPSKKAKRKIRAAFKLGGYAIVGTVVEKITESNVHLSPLPWLSLAGGIGSFTLNWYVHKRFADHDHEDAEEVRGHARTDLTSSAITVGSSALAFVWTPLLFAGSLTHIGLYGRQAYKTYSKFKHQAHYTSSSDDQETPEHPGLE
jgi:Co/Zn/Cd efflux system component